MDVAEAIRCGTAIHGHPCPPLVLGIRAGFVAMARLGVGRAVDRELFAFVELGSDHYAQGFADGVQVATGCTFGKDLIARLPHGKSSVRVVDQVRGRAVRVSARPEATLILEQSAWFRTCASTGGFASGSGDLVGPVVDELAAARDDALFAVSAPFPLGIEDPHPSYESIRCDACGESVLARYVRGLDGRRLCIACEERRRFRLR